MPLLPLCRYAKQHLYSVIKRAFPSETSAAQVRLLSPICRNHLIEPQAHLRKLDLTMFQTSPVFRPSFLLFARLVSLAPWWLFVTLIGLLIRLNYRASTGWAWKSSRGS
jgi:hypothetical protein